MYFIYYFVMVTSSSVVVVLILAIVSFAVSLSAGSVSCKQNNKLELRTSFYFPLSFALYCDIAV